MDQLPHVVVIGAGVLLGSLGNQLIESGNKRARERMEQDAGTPSIGPVLPNQSDQTSQHGRELQLNRIRQQYQVVYAEPYPPFVSGLPRCEVGKQGAPRVFQVFGELGAETIESVLKKPYSLVKMVFTDPESPWSAWEEVLPTSFDFGSFGHRVVPLCLQNEKQWKEDSFFAQTMLNGPNPYAIRRFTKKLDNFPVTDEMVSSTKEWKDGLGRNDTISSMMKKGLLYYCDYKDQEGLPVKEGHEDTFPKVIALFGVINGRLMPLAIQLGQTKGSMIVTPKDPNPALWLLAKMYANQCYVQDHAFKQHVMTCHLIPETVYLTARRNLADAHPVWQLIHAHFFFTITVNYAARTSLINSWGFASQLYAAGYDGINFLCKKEKDSFSWAEWNVPSDLKNRGVEDTSKLPGYFYRDDAVDLHQIIHEYVEQFVSSTYKTEALLAEDYELQAWSKELLTIFDIPGCPIDAESKRLESREALVELLTDFIFTVSGRHAAVNNAQYDYFSFPPSCSPSVQVKVPTEENRNDITVLQIASGLPGWKNTALGIGLTLTLSTPPEPNQLLGSYGFGNFLENRPQFTAVVEKYLREPLQNLSDKIEKRNNELEESGEGVPYRYLDPAQVASSVEI